MQPQVTHHHYDSTYDTKARFCSYWTQINEVLRLAPCSLLEIGIGSGLVNSYLRERGVCSVGIDIAMDLTPNVLASGHCLPFKDGSFDMAMACQVLEHIPFETAQEALVEIARVTRRYALISVPNANSAYPIQFTLPRLGKIRLIPRFPHTYLFAPIRRYTPSDQHCWEIGWRDYPLKRIINAIETAGFRIERHYRLFEFAYQHFFVLEKIQAISR